MEDKYSEEMLKYLGMATTSDQKTKPVGTIAGAVGPFGHVDMFGHVWQLVGDLGFGPIHDMDTFLASWKELQKHKTGRIVELKPTYQGHKTIAKGGMEWLKRVRVDGREFGVRYAQPPLLEIVGGGGVQRAP